jgi:hypothetical protein
MTAARDTWELRFITETLAAPLEFAIESAGFAAAGPGFEERDVYLLTGSERTNLKVRFRGDRLKLKTLQETAPDHVERWRTELDVPLPAGAEVVERVLLRLGAPGDAGALGTAATAAALTDALAGILPPGRMVAVVKQRRLFRDGSCRADVVRFTVGTRRYASLGLESETALELRAHLPAIDLPPAARRQNYMQLLYARPAPARATS